MPVGLGVPRVTAHRCPPSHRGAGCQARAPGTPRPRHTSPVLGRLRHEAHPGNLSVSGHSRSFGQGHSHGPAVAGGTGSSPSCASPGRSAPRHLCPHLDAAPRRRAARGLRGACRPRRGSHSSLALARGSGLFPGFGGCELSLRKHAQRVLEEASLSRLSQHGAAETVGRAACAESRGSFWVRGAGAVADDSGAHRTRPPGGTRPPGP